MKPNLAHRISMKRHALLLSCASLAIATAALAPQKARAQAFNGEILSSTNASQTSVGIGTETITVTGPTATINWTPSEAGTGTINFLPSSNTVTFTGASEITDYTVLNRIVPSTDPTRAIGLNGTVLSTLAGGATGGNIWFVSPGGIVVGATATFDVGGLLLSSLDATIQSADGSGFSATFAPFAGTTPGAVQVLDGAQISALQQNSYVALVAPRVEQGGTVKVDGSAAYVAANNLTMTMNQGLFDIQVDVGGGTDDVNGIVHTGSTIGGDTSSLSTNHAVYMVAVPKNQALTMLLGGTVGYDSTVAGYENGKIVLSAGWSIADTGTGYDPNTEYVVDAGIDIGPGDYLSDVFAIARGDITAIADTGNIDFAGNVNLNTYDAAATGNVALGATNGYDLNVGGNISMLTSNPAYFSEASIYADGGATVDVSGNVTMVASAGEGDGGDASITAGGQSIGGTVNIDGTVDINVDGQYFSAATSDSSAGTAYGGDININAYNDGVISTGAMTLNANAYGQDSLGGYSSETYSGYGGDGYGGDVYINADGGGTITVNGNLTARAQGSGGNTTESGNWGGDADGGDVTLSVGDGTVNVTGDVTLSASALGGTGGSQAGGDAWGGYANINSYGPGSITIGGSTDLRAEATGGDGQSGGAGYGGNAGAYGDAGTIALGPDSYLSARGTGGDANVGFGGSGGYGEGGVAFIEADSDPGYPGEIDPTAGTITGNLATIDTSGTGGTGGKGDGVDIVAGDGGYGQGGYYCGGDCAGGGAFALAQVGGASLTLGQVTLTSNGTGGAGGVGGAGQVGGNGGEGWGGSVQAGDFDPNAAGTTDSSAAYGRLELVANGIGGSGGAAGSGGASSGDGGDAYGGGAFYNAQGTDNTAGSIRMLASAIGGSGNFGGDALDGTVALHAFTGSSLTITNRLQLGWGDDELGGSGGTGVVQGGSGTGGTTSLTVDSGATVTAARAIVNAIGYGGDSVAGTGGTGTGGDTSITVGGTLKLGSLTSYADANGGASASGTGGDAFAGSASLTLDGGTLQGVLSTSPLNSVAVTADALGGGGAIGGDATGGDTTFQMTANGGHLTSNRLELHSWGNYNGTGAGSSEGGDGVGGTVLYDVASTLNGGATATINLGTVFIQTNGTGGSGPLAGNGTGGVTTVNFGAAQTTITGTTTISADGMGGSGTVNGTGTGGDVELTIDAAGPVSFADAVLGADGAGGLVGITGDLNATGHVDLSSGGNITFDNVAADHFQFEADGAVTGGNINAATHIDGNANGAIVLGDIIVAPNLAANGDYSVGIASATSITVGNVSVAGGVGFATLGGLTTGNLGAGDIVLLMASGDISTGSIETGADGRVYIADGSMFILGGGGGDGDFDPNIVLALDPIPTGGSIAINGPVTTGRLQAAAGTELSLGDVTASQSAELYAGGLANFTGTVSAPDITVTSGDINVAEGASLGVFGITDLITLNAMSDGQPVIIGNPGEAPVAEGQYHLGNEAGDIETNALVINALATGDSPAPDILVYDAHIEGSQTDGGGVSSVTLNTDGSVFVDGIVDFTNAGADDSLTVNAGQNIEVNTDTGGIQMVDSSEQYAGTLNLNADNIWVASSGVLSQLEEDPNFSGRDLALATNSGSVISDGFVRAGAVTADIRDTIFVQNSGTSDDFAGITVGDGGLAIVSSSEGGAAVDVYGRQVQSDGTVVSGDDFANGADTSGTFTSGSKINNCVIGVQCGVTPPPPPPPVPPPSPPPVPPPPVPPPPVPPPPVPPPPVPPPPVVPHDVGSSDGLLGPLGQSNGSLGFDSSQDQGSDDQGDDDSDDSDDGKKTNVEATLGLINAGPVQPDQQVDDPVTSGGEWMGDDVGAN
jgi:filamentous hemagglutinin family protein